MTGKQMCILGYSSSTLSCGCRSAWYMSSDACDTLYAVHIPNDEVRKDVCNYAEGTHSWCDATKFEIAT
ncbi:hypothetical protein ADUPG1_004070, partial [Aduncisulcus paluster]